MTAPAWLAARPIAHRGLHDRARGVIENTGAAARAAISGGFAIECDVQRSADGEAVVFHDFTLERLTGAQGRVDALTAEALAGLALKECGERIMTLDAFLALIDGRAPLICEIKSRFDGDLRLARRAAEVAARASGPVALKSFDPEIVVFLRQESQALGLGLGRVPLGVVAMAKFHDAETPLDAGRRLGLDQFLHWERSRPDFLSYCVDDLPHAVPFLLRAALGLPVLTWTVRSREQAARARQWADQFIFEGQIVAG